MGHYRVIIRGAYGEGNFGDDVLMVACHSLLRRVFAAEDIAVHFTSRGPGRYTERLIPGIRIVRYESIEATADFIVWGGGTQFYSFPKTKTSRHAKLRAALANPMVLANYAAKKWNVWSRRPKPRFIGLGLGVGPFVAGSLEESYTRDLLGTMDFLAVRDLSSISLCRAWGLEKAILRSDLCFMDDTWRPGPAADPRPAPGRKVGVIVRDWPHNEATSYYRSLFNAVASLRGKGFEVQFISFRPGGDQQLTSLLAGREERVLGWEPERQTIADFLAALAGFDCFVTARYHGALFAALLGKPLVCIDLEPKLQLVSELLSSPLWKQPFDPAECVSLVEGLFDRRAEYVSELLSAADAQRTLASSMVSEFLAYLDAVNTGCRDTPGCASLACTDASP